MFPPLSLPQNDSSNKHYHTMLSAYASVCYWPILQMKKLRRRAVTQPADGTTGIWAILPRSGCLALEYSQQVCLTTHKLPRDGVSVVPLSPQHWAQGWTSNGCLASICRINEWMDDCKLQSCFPVYDSIISSLSFFPWLWLLPNN